VIDEQRSHLSRKERLGAAKTAYLAIPSSLKRGGEDVVLAQARRYFPHLKIGAYRGEFENSADWRANFASYIAEVDCLIVACDSSRLVGPGVLREIKAAKRAQTLIVLFKVDDGQHRMFFGYEKMDAKQARLKKRSERFRQTDNS